MAMYLMSGLQTDLHSEITISEAMTRQQENNNVYSKNNILCILCLLDRASS